MQTRELIAALASRAHGVVSSRYASWTLWLGSFAVPAHLTFTRRLQAVPYHEYVLAGERWRLHEPLYDLTNIDGFQYFPQAALLFAPLAQLGSPWGELLWLASGWAAFACALSQMAARLEPRRAHLTFTIASALAVGPAITNLFNGQANLWLAALSLFAAVALIDRRYWRASMLLTFGVALKPLMVVPMLLLLPLYPALWLRLPAALTPMLAAPFLLRDARYVLAQWLDCIRKIQLCADPDRLFEDLRGLLASANLSLSTGQYWLVRAIAALVVLGLAALVRVRRSEPRATLLVVSLALSYLVLFNPRTLSSSYVMPGGCLALLATHALLERQTRKELVLLAIVIAWSVNHHAVPWVEFWLRPLTCFVFLGVLAHEARAPVQTTSELSLPRMATRVR